MLKHSESEKAAVREIFLNRVQLLVNIVNASKTILPWGRGTGKTFVMTIWLLRRMLRMVRSVGIFGGPSYTKLLSHMIPEIIVGLESFGLKKEEDFVVCKRPPKNFNLSILPPEKYDNVLSLKNGSMFHLLGFDYSTSANGLSAQYIALDEYKKLPHQRIQKELMPILRGGYRLFKDCPEYLSVMITSDKNIGPRDHNHITDYKVRATDNETIIMICALHARIETEQDPVVKAILIEERNELQKEATLYLEASTLENLANLGLKFFVNQDEILEADDFLESILNVTLKKTKGAFYTLLDEDVHTYTPDPNHRYLDRIGSESYVFERDCEGDTDWRPELPIKLGVDLGGTFNWFVVNQLYNDTYYCLHGYYMKAPLKYEDGIDKFCKYYSKHKNKRVEFYYDVQANKANARNAETDAEVMIRRLRANGWIVVNKTDHMKYIHHYIKHRIWLQGLDTKAERDPRYKKFKINMTNAEGVFNSMAGAKTKEGYKTEIEKDKSSERPDSGVKPWDATHFSDVQDYIYCTDHVQLVSKPVLVW